MEYFKSTPLLNVQKMNSIATIDMGYMAIFDL